MAAPAQAEVQALLAFLTREAKVPLAAALPKYNALRSHGLTTPDAIAKSDPDILKTIFGDDKVVKQVHGAAKRVSNPKKRAASSPIQAPSSSRPSADDREAQLAPPETTVSIDDLRQKTIETNRAPLFLAFAFSVTKYTLPDQPLSSRWSLAQAVTSAGAQSKAKYIGLTTSTAEEEGWADGQPKLRIMGRDIAVMRRHVQAKKENDVPDDLEGASPAMHEAFWGIDLEALRKSNGPLVAGAMSAHPGPPVHQPEAARGYLLKSIDLVETQPVDDTDGANVKREEASPPAKRQKASVAEKAARRARAVAMLLKAIDHVCASWASTLTADELDRRASSWYAKVRPEVEGGQAGWGQRGQVPLSTILDLAHHPP